MGRNTKVWYLNVKEIAGVVGTTAVSLGYLYYLTHKDDTVSEEEAAFRRKEREQSFLFKAKRKLNKALIERFHLDD